MVKFSTETKITRRSHFAIVATVLITECQQQYIQYIMESNNLIIYFVNKQKIGVLPY